jgi:predicted RNase H-like nuclease (RuvC/YqgF family)
MELDAELEEIERGLEFLKMEARRFQDECRKIMMDGKKEHDRMTQDGYQLQSLLKESQNKVKQLQEELAKAHLELQDAETNVAGEVQNVEVILKLFSSVILPTR